MSNFLSMLGAAMRKSVLSPIDVRTGYSNVIREPNTGAWQRNQEISVDTVTAQHAVYACVTLVANDFGKLRPRLTDRTDDGIRIEVDNPAYSPVLRKPNRYQNYIQFKEWWATSKLLRGNTYALKQRDARGVVTALYILDPDRVQPLVAEDGSIFYSLGQDNLTGLQEAGVVVPASEIIHDRMNCLFHPLVGMSPLFASGLAASQGLSIQNDAATFFQNGSRPGGILTAPGNISDENAKRLKEYFDTNFAGSNRGKVAVLGDDLKFQALRMTASESQMIEQLGWTAQVVCSTFHVPPFKVQLGSLPTGMKVSDINLLYYSDCLQSIIEQFELCMDEGLGLGQRYETNLDIDGLMRMDPSAQADFLTKLVGGTIMKPNEARQRLNLPGVKGGDAIYMQVQNYNLEALARRDERQDPPSSIPASQPVATPEPDQDPAQQVRELFDLLQKGLQ